MLGKYHRPNHLYRISMNVQAEVINGTQGNFFNIMQYPSTTLYESLKNTWKAVTQDKKESNKDY